MRVAASGGTEVPALLTSETVALPFRAAFVPGMKPGATALSPKIRNVDSKGHAIRLGFVP